MALSWEKTLTGGTGEIHAALRMLPQLQMFWHTRTRVLSFKKHKTEHMYTPTQMSNHYVSLHRISNIYLYMCLCAYLKVNCKRKKAASSWLLSFCFFYFIESVGARPQLGKCQTIATGCRPVRMESMSEVCSGGTLHDGADIYFNSFMPAGKYCNKPHGGAVNGNSHESWSADPTGYMLPKVCGHLNKVGRNPYRVRLLYI